MKTDEYRVEGVVAINGEPKIWANTWVHAASPEEALALACADMARRCGEDPATATWAKPPSCENLSALRREAAYRRFDPGI